MTYLSEKQSKNIFLGELQLKDKLEDTGAGEITALTGILQVHIFS
jgi:hypothetical protein